MVDRGADLSWLSQYPHELEVLFPPLTGLEALSTEIDGSTLLVITRLSLNMASLTLEQACAAAAVLPRRILSLFVHSFSHSLSVRTAHAGALTPAEDSHGHGRRNASRGAADLPQESQTLREQLANLIEGVGMGPV